MRVLFFSNAFPTPDDPGRAVFNRQLVASLARDHEVRVIAPVSWLDRLSSRVGWRRRSARREPWPVAYPVAIYLPRLERWKAAAIRWSTRATVSDLCREWRPDVVLGYWGYPDGAVALAIARRLGASAVVFSGGSDVLISSLRPAYRKRLARVLSSADAVVTASRHLKARVETLGVSPDRVHVLRRDVDDTVFRPGDPRASRLRLGVDPDVPVIVWAGRFVSVKRVDVVLDAFRQLIGDLPSARLVLVGDGPLRTVMAQRANDLNPGAVLFDGLAAQPRLADWLRAADAVVLASDSEGTPNVLLEAQACGRPFVSTDVGGVSEIARPGIDRLVPPGDVLALARALHEIVGDARRRVPLPVPEGGPSPGQQLADAVSRPRMRPLPSARRRASPFRQGVKRLLIATTPRAWCLDSVPAASNAVCLTFDDGPDPGSTPKILDALAAEGAYATFFVLGRQVERYPELTRRIVADGHELGHHSFGHGDPALVSASDLAIEIDLTSNLLERLGVPRPSLVRPPHGKLTPAKWFRLMRRKTTTVLWNRDPRDYSLTSPQELLARFGRQLPVAGDIVLLHDTARVTAEALPAILALIRGQRLRCVTVSAALQRSGS